jgi:tetratricopeptide (TPR) repeat protein
MRRGVFVAPHSYEHFVRGELARVAGDFELALEHYEMARAGAADDPLLLARIAEMSDSMGDRDRARRALDEGERLDPDAEVIWSTRGAIAERHGELEQAIDSYMRAAALSEGHEESVIALSRVLRESGAEERANAVLERYLVEHSGGAGAARTLLTLALSRSDLRTAGLAALELVRRSPLHAREIVRVAEELLDAGRPIIAHRLLVMLPEGAASRSLLLRAAVEAGARSEAEALLLTYTPETIDEITSVAEAWLALGDPRQAAEASELAIARGGGAAARLLLARAYLQDRKISEAAALLASIPAGSSAYEEATRLIGAVLEENGLPALAAEASGLREINASQ